VKEQKSQQGVVFSLHVQSKRYWRQRGGLAMENDLSYELYQAARTDPDVETLTPFKLKAILDEPHFEIEDRMHSWRNYVPDYLKALWPKLSVDQRLIIYIMAQRQAGISEHPKTSA
jgi:hypothetical protein